METMFFNCVGTLADVARRVFLVIGLPDYVEGDSVHVVGSEYYVASALGIRIKLEINGYDYEDDYGFMLFIEADFQSSSVVHDSAVKLFSQFIARILSDNLNARIAIEINEGDLELVEPLPQ